MTNRKNQNSILFLTTLGVYLGLLVVGGSAPQVFAHSATTRNFEITDEIEVKDDLDTNPDAPDFYADSLVSLVGQLDILSSKKVFDWNAKSNITIEDFNFCESDNSRAYSGFGTISKKTDGVITDNVANLADQVFRLKSQIGAGEYFTGWPQGLSYEFIVQNRELNLKVSIVLKDPASAARLGHALGRSLELVRSSSKKPQQLVAENTKSKVEDVKVILVTHLARADLEVAAF